MNTGHCMLSNTLKLAILAGLWVIGKLLDQWELDWWTFFLFGWVYCWISDDCTCNCPKKEEDDGE